MNKCLIKISGKNIKNFLIKLDSNKIEVLNIKNITKDEIIILTYIKNLEKIEEIKSIYEVTIIKEYGTKKIKDMLNKNLYLLIILFINIFFVFFITRYIYEVEVIEDNHDIRKYVINVLNDKGIKKYNKKPKDLMKIKNDILKENKDYLEWIEIIPSGIKYIVKLEERITNEKKTIGKPSNIVAKKDGVIKKIIASNGKIVAIKDTFVKKGDILITGVLNENKLVPSAGKVYAEVWYKVTTSAPIHEKKEEITGKEKKGLKIRFFDKEINFYKKYQSNEIKENIIFKNSIIPFYLSFDLVREINYVDKIYTVDEALVIAKNKAKAEIQKKLKDEETIINENELKVEVKNSKILVDVLIVTIEDIGEVKEIEDKNVQRNN